VTGIAAPEPRVMVTCLGVSPDLVRVVDVRRSRSDVDQVRIEIGDVYLVGDLRSLTLVVERISMGLMEIEGSRNGGEL
jgi:hypothetical protein